MKIVNRQSKGFTLIEVLIALIVSSIALLGLASGQLKSLQYATNSFNYTASLIQANNAIEIIWDDICALQRGDKAFDQAYLSSLDPEFDSYEIEFEGVLVNNFNNNFTIKVKWDDERMTDGLDSQIAINAAFPKLPDDCNV